MELALLKGLIKGNRRLNQLSKILVEGLKANSNNYKAVVSILLFLILLIAHTNHQKVRAETPGKKAIEPSWKG